MATLVWIYGSTGTPKIIHPPGEVNAMSISARRVKSRINRLAWNQWDFHLYGELIGTDTADVDAKIAALETAYADDGEDLGLYIDNGGGSYTATQHRLISINSTNGVRVEVLVYPSNEPEEMVVQRSFRIHARAEYLNVESQIFAYEDNLRFIGTGGPWQQYYPILGANLPVLEVPFLNTPQRIIQTGFAIGLQGYPAAVAPFTAVDTFEDFSRRQIQTGNPMKQGINEHLLYPIRWTYNLWAKQGVAGVPLPEHPDT